MYYGAAFVVSRLSSDDKSIRIPACLADLLSIPLLGGLAYRLFGARTALLSSLLLTLSVYHIEYSQDARPYTLLILWSLTAFHGFLSFVRTKSMSGLVLLAFSLLASLYTHHTAFFLCGAIALSGLSIIFHRWWSSGRFPLELAGGLAGSAIVVALGFWPQLAHLKAYLATSNLDKTHTLALTGHFFVELFNRWTFGAPWGALAAGLLALGLVRSCRSLKRAAILLPWIAIPFLLFGFVPFGKFFDIRFAIVAFPAFLVLVGSGLDWMIEGLTGTVARLPPLADADRTAVGYSIEALCALFLVSSAVPPYRHFRRLTDRCSNFFYRPELMREQDGICERQLILNSLWGPHAFILKRYAPSDDSAAPLQADH